MSDYAYNHNVENALSASVKKLTDELFLLDAEIGDWASELDRAQPIISGRIVIKFTNKCKVRIGDKREIDAIPAAAKLVRNALGQWKMVWLSPKQLEKGLANLRVARNYASDAVVARLLEGIEDMMQQRERLTKLISEFRSGAVYAIKAASSVRDKRSGQIGKLRERIKIDWKADPSAAKERLRQENAERYQKRKARKAAQAIMAAAKSQPHNNELQEA